MPDTTPAKGSRIYAIANQKGGVGKTTTAINLGAALAESGKQVLIIDIDPQGNASTGLGIAPEARQISTYDLLLGDAVLSAAMQQSAVKNLRIVPATTDLSSADLDLVSNDKRSTLMRTALHTDEVRALGLDHILIDCPPSLSLLTINALVAADAVIVPLQSEFFALEGLSQLMLTVRDIRERANPRLRIEGIALTMHDARNNLARQVEQDARENLGDLVFDTVIPRNVRLSEAPSFAMPVFDYDPSSRGAKAYKALADELMAREA